MPPPLSPEQEQLLHTIYYDEKNMFGRDKLFKLVQYNTNISRRQVADWLSRQMTQQIFHPAHKPKDVQPAVASGPFAQIGIDLADLTTYADNGYKWILTAIDMTKRGYAVPLKDKSTKSMIPAMKELLSQMTKPPRMIRSDNGSEFINSEFVKLLKDRGIKQVFSSPSKPQSNGQVERFNSTLKLLIKKSYLYSGVNSWVKDLPQFLNNYNNSYQRIIQMTPNEVEAATVELEEEVHTRILKNVTSRRPLDKQQFETGDTVRIRLEQQDNQKRSEPWSRDTYTVKQAFKPRVDHRSWQYSLEELEGRYYNDDLQLIKSIENPIQLPEQYLISKIVRPATRNNAPSYEILWKGFKDHTIEPRSALLVDVPKLLDKFERDHAVKWTQSKGKHKFTWKQ